MFNHKTACEKRRFGIVEISGEKYALIDINENKMILQKCEIDSDVLKIYSNTYLCTDNKKVIHFNIFDNVIIF